MKGSGLYYWDKSQLFLNSTSKIDHEKASSAPESIICILKVHILNMAVLIEIYIVHISFFLMYHRVKKA